MPISALRDQKALGRTSALGAAGSHSSIRIELAISAQRAVETRRLALTGPAHHDLALLIASCVSKNARIAGFHMTMDDPIATARMSAVVGAVIIVDPISVVALFSVCLNAISTGSETAICIAPISAEHVAVITELSLGLNAIPTRGESAVGIAAIAIDAVAVVAHVFF